MPARARCVWSKSEPASAPGIDTSRISTTGSTATLNIAISMLHSTGSREDALMMVVSVLTGSSKVGGQHQ